MKKILALAIPLLWASPIFASPVIVYGKGDFTLLDSGGAQPAPTDPAKAAFFSAFKADLAQPAPFAVSIKLVGPPEWGKTIPNAVGTLRFHPSFPGGFLVHVGLVGLEPGHRYILTLNGNPKLAGNELLPDLVPGMASERYLDFLTVTTDDSGRYEATFAIALRPGSYDVRFYVKDTDDFKIVLYHDYFKFTVE